jgi:hypothetical protein
MHTHTHVCMHTQTLQEWRKLVRENKGNSIKVEAGGRRAGEALAGTILFPFDVASTMVKTVSALLPKGSAAAKWRTLCADEKLEANEAGLLLYLADQSFEDAYALATIRASPLPGRHASKVQSGPVSRGRLRNIHDRFVALRSTLRVDLLEMFMRLWEDGLVWSKCDRYFSSFLPVFLPVCVYIRIYIHMFMCVYVYIYIYIYTYMYV